MNSLLRFILLTAIWLSGGITALQAQFIITYPAPASSLDVCGASGATVVRIDVSTSGSSGNVAIDFPPGIHYIPGSLTRLEGNINAIEEADLSNLNRPVFTVSSVLLGQFIVFSVERNADACIARTFALGGGTFKDTVVASSSAGAVVEASPALNPYNVRIPSLSITDIAAVSTVVGQTLFLPFSLANGGFGALQSATLLIEEPESDVFTDELVLLPSGIIISGTADVAGGIRTIRYDLGSDIFMQAGNGDALLNEGESLQLARRLRVLGCNPTSTYTVHWGCDPDPCQSATESQPVNIVEGVPILSLENAVVVQATNTCDELQYSITLSNTASESATGAATAFDLSILFAYNASGAGISLSHDSRIGQYTRVQIGDATLPILGAGTNANPYRIDLTNLSEDPGTGLADADGDGFFDDLPAGASIDIIFSVQYDCSSACPANHTQGRPRTGVDFRDQCGNLQPRNFSSSTTAFISNRPDGNPSVIGPGNISDGETIEVTFCGGPRVENINANNGQPWACPSNVLTATIELPPGISLASSMGRFNATIPITASQTGNIVTASTNANSGSGENRCFTLNFSLDCSAFTGASTFHTEISYQCDTACSCVERWGCFDYTPNIVCDACNNGGLTTLPVSADRSTLGWTDRQLSTRAIASQLPPLNLKKALPCDSIHIQVPAYLRTSPSAGPVTGAFIAFSYQQIGGNKLLNYLPGGIIRKFDSSTGNYSTCPLPAATDTVINGTHQVVFSFNDCIASNGLSEGDSIIVDLDALVLNNTALSATPALIPQWRVQHGIVQGADTLRCAPSFIPFFLHRYAIAGGAPNIVNIQGCEAGDLADISLTANSNQDDYPGEIRPFAKIDSIEVFMASNDTISEARLISRINDSALGNATTTTPISSIFSNGRYVFINPGNWPFADPSQATSQYQFAPVLQSRCQSVDAALNVRIHYSPDYYALNSSCRPPAASVNRNIAIQHLLPNLSLTSQGGTANITTQLVRWDVSLANTTAAIADHVWLSIAGSSAFEIMEVRNSTTQQTYPLEIFDNGIWIRAGSVASSAPLLLEIVARVLDCGQNQIQLYAGWDCAGYPSPAPSSSPCLPVSLLLNTLELPAEVQLAVFEQPSSPIPACEPFAYTLVVNSAQASNLTDVLVEIALPEGLQYIGNIEVEYPLGSGNRQIISNAGNAQLLLLDLSATGIWDSLGLPGISQASNSNLRQAAVRMHLITNCDFIPGSVIESKAFATTPCGAPAISSGTIVPSGSIEIIGINTPYLVSTSAVWVHPSPDCSSTPYLDIQHLIIGSGATTPNDYIEIILPPGVSSAGLLNCLPDTSFVPVGATHSLNPDQSTTVRMQLREGISGGDIIHYYIGIADSICGDNRNILIRTGLTIAGTACATALPDFLCPNFDLETSEWVIQDTRASIQLTASPADTLTCSNPVTTLSVDVTNGHLVNLEYRWQNSTGEVLPSTSDSLQVMEAGTYSLFLRNPENGCTENTAFEVTQDTIAPVLHLQAADTLTCLRPTVSIGVEDSTELARAAWFLDGIEVSRSFHQMVSTAGVYTLTAAAAINGCTATDSIRVFQDTMVQHPMLSASGILNCTTDSVLLTVLPADASAYNFAWNSANGANVSTGSDAVVYAAGVYQLLLTSTRNGCNRSASISVGEDIRAPIVGISSSGPITCVDSLASIFITSDDASMSYSYRMQAPSGAFELDSITDISVALPGTYTLFAQNTLNGCIDSVSTLVIANLVPPVAAAEGEGSFPCYGDYTVSAAGSSGQGVLTYQWYGGDNALLGNQQRQTITASGLYRLLVTDLVNGCQAQDTITLMPTVIENVLLDVRPAPCPGETAAIAVQDVEGGTAPFVYSIDGGNQFITSGTFTGLNNDMYHFVVQDALGCEWDTSIFLPRPDTLVVRLAGSIHLDLGDSINIMPELSLPVNLQSIVWTPEAGLSCRDCLTPVMRPVENTTYELLVVSEAGCTARAATTVRVNKQWRIYFPTAFSPHNNDQINDAFTFFAPANYIRQVLSFRIFDRWGSMVFQYDQNAASAQPQWGGTIQSLPAPGGVYVFQAVLERFDGAAASFAGEVLLIR